MKPASPPRRSLGLQLCALLPFVAVWAALHWAFGDILIPHDSWRHNFPEVYDVARNSACGTFAYWLASPDTGAATIAYALSVSLTQPLRVILLNWWACTHPAPFDAMLMYEFQVFAIYLVFTLGMFVLGRVLFRHWLSAVYLAAATLFAGIAMQSVHSDQYVILAFWIPWCAAAWTLAHRHAGSRRGALYVNVAGAFFCVALGDQEPHAAALAGGCALLVYAGGCFRDVRSLAARWYLYWPVLATLGVCLAGFFVVRANIFEYLTSQHPTITFDPSQLGETGFVQPSALLGMLFPLSFTSAFDQIPTGLVWRASIFRLDVVFFYLGTLPLLLFLSLFVRRGLRGAPLGWMVFTVGMLLVSLQPTQLYWAVFHLPLFYLFRSYFFYFAYVAVGTLVLSGYGFDRLMSVSREDRAAIVSRTLALSTFLFAAGAAAIAANAVPGRGLGGIVFHLYGPEIAGIGIVVATFLAVAAGLSIAGGHMSWTGAVPCWRGAAILLWALAILVFGGAVAFLVVLLDTAITNELRNQWAPLAGDAMILATSFSAAGWAMRRPTFGVRHGLVLIAILVATQSIHVVGVYDLLGQPAHDIFARYDLDRASLTPYSAAELADPGTLKRVPCATNAACFLAQRDAASLKRDTDGTFLRHRLNPVFQDALSPESRAALVGVTHPILWASTRLEPVSSIDTLDALVEAHKDDLASFLRQQTYVVGASAPQTHGGPAATVAFGDWQRGPNLMSFHYRADGAAIINLAVTDVAGWAASIDGTPVTPLAGNFDMIALPVSKGEGTVVLTYRNWGSLFYFWSRWIMGALALLGVGVVAWHGRPGAAVT